MEILFSVEFLARSIALDWADVFWGYKNQLIGWRVPVDIAKANLDAGLPQNALEIQLAHIDKNDDWQVGILTRDLAQYNPIPEDVSKKSGFFYHYFFYMRIKTKTITITYLILSKKFTLTLIIRVKLVPSYRICRLMMGMHRFYTHRVKIVTEY